VTRSTSKTRGLAWDSQVITKTWQSSETLGRKAHLGIFEMKNRA